MYIAHVDFPLQRQSVDKVVDAAMGLLGTWHKNGQVVGDSWPAVTESKKLRFVVSIPEADSLDPRHANEWVARAHDDLIEAGLGRPEIAVLGPDPASSQPCDCGNRSSLILFTHYMSLEPPLWCGDCFAPVPLYQIPSISGGEYLDILQWEADYKACDTLQMHCTTGERFGERQLGSHDSSLSSNGLAICEAISKSTGLPTYYYLLKIRGRSKKQELARKCPSCGEAWLLTEPLHDLFEFKCDRCFLLSNLACNVF